MSGAIRLIFFRISILSEKIGMSCTTMQMSVENETKTFCFSFATIFGDRFFICDCAMMLSRFIYCAAKIKLIIELSKFYIHFLPKSMGTYFFAVRIIG